MNSLILPHGGYKNLKAFQMSEIIYDFTVEFCQKFIRPIGPSRSYRSNRLVDQMVQAARSGRQNIAEGSKASGTSKKTELKLVNVARASLEELLLDYQDWLRQHKFSLWNKDCAKAKEVRALAYKSNKSYATYMPYLASPETAANCAICLIHQTNFLLDKLLQQLSQSFLRQGGFTERLYQARRESRANRSYKTN